MKNSDYQIIVTTADKSAWTLKTFAYLWNVYYSSIQDVHVLYESFPNFRLPDNFKQHIINLDGVEGWPQQLWSDGLIKYLHSIREQYVLIMLDDYWLVRTVDVRGIGTLFDYLREHPNLLRVDLTGDRLYARGVENVDMYGHFDIVAAQGSEYQMSLMPGMWNKKHLMDVLQHGWTPWQVELDGTGVVNSRPELLVVGTRQWPIRIVNGLRNSLPYVDIEGIDEPHLSFIKKSRFLEMPTKQEYDASQSETSE